ncbi:MAG: DUF5615 family PIN-like protein [Fimbriimonadales bacterium]|nr:DUF5615 family PIN-like protein [Fimbriimonadales bacterium]
MRFKIDENLNEAVAQRLRQEGYSVETVLTQHLCGVEDNELIEVCKQEQRCLITLDMDFANPFLFPPNQYAGIVALKLLGGRNPLAEIASLIETLISALQHESPVGKLWIVEIGRVRVYQPETDDD